MVDRKIPSGNTAKTNFSTFLSPAISRTEFVSYKQNENLRDIKKISIIGVGFKVLYMLQDVSVLTIAWDYKKNSLIALSGYILY